MSTDNYDLSLHAVYSAMLTVALLVSSIALACSI
jgi:hypothetical protein